MINSSDILRGKVLIVDDTPANVVLLEEMLKGTGYTSVKSTANPREVCALHRDNQFDLIMLDLQMPDMDGFHVMAGLKEVEPDGDLSVLVLTARPEHKILALKAGAKGFISKPFNLAEVLVQVHNLIEMRLLRRSADLLSASRLENSQRMAGLGDWDYDFTTNRSIWSDEIYRILGISREEFPPGSETFERMVHPDDKPPFLREKTAASQGNRCSNLEHRIVRPDGRIRHIHYVSEVISNGNGRPGHEAGTVQDITDRKLAEEDLRKSEERYRTMLMISPDAHVVLVGGVITFVNRAFCRLTGAAEPAQWIGRPVREVVHHDWHSYIEALVAQGPDEKRRPRAEIKFVRRDGTSVDVEVSNVVFDFRGRRELQLIARDITERKQLELHFRQANKMEALGRFSGGIAHDFNNIIMGISGYAELARLNLEGNETARAHIGAVLQAAHRAAELVRQILTFSRQQPQERLVIQLQPIIQECAKLLQGTIPSSVVFEVSVAADAPAVLADASQIHRVLMNLATNAWQAMKGQQGRLKVKLEGCVVDETHAAVLPRLQPGLYARLSVSDTGCGMTQSVLQHIFEPFFTTKPTGEGTGLGLAVVHGIMESHDGTVTVQSEPGEGTTFQLFFPAHCDAAAKAAASEDPAPCGHGERILIVDDEASLAKLWERSLASLGYKAEFTSQPADALAIVSADPQRFALVLTDQVMPGMSGMALASKLLQIRPDLPILLMTGFTASLTAEHVKASGIRQLLLKPIPRGTMAAAIHMALLATPSLAPWPESPSFATAPSGQTCASR